MSQSLNPSPAFPSQSGRAPVSRPPTTGYWLAGLLAAAGVLAAIVWAVLAVFALRDHVAGFTHLSAPGETTFPIASSGQYVVYFEGPGSRTIEQLGLAITGPRGEPISLQPYANGIKYDAINQAGESVARFQASETGQYRLKVGPDAPGARVAVGDNFTGSLVATILGIVALVLATNGGALLLALRTYRRSLT
jgi:hypothetical protein